jgi:CHAT domain-containing protein
MFKDPALVLSCDLPMGWCLDAESSLFRVVFRPWNRRDERIVLTVLPTAVAPVATDDDWAAAVTSRFGLGDDVAPLTIAAGAAMTATFVMANGWSYRRMVVRGPTLDLVADHVQSVGRSEEISPVLLRIAASTRAPARPPYLDPDAESLEDARVAFDALSMESDADSIVQACWRLERAAEEKWLRSLLQGNLNLVDLNALEALLLPRLTLGQSAAYLLKLCKAHAVLMRAVPNQSPTEPYIPVDEHLRPALATRCEAMFGGVAVALRRRRDLEKYKTIPDDLFGSDSFLQMMLGTLIIGDVRSAFQHGQRPSSAAAYEGLLAQLCSQGTMTPDDSEADQSGQLAERFLLLGRAVTAYVEAAQHEDDRDSVVEAAEYLTAIGRKLFDAAANADEKAELYRSEGATYAVTGLENCASALVKTGDQTSLEEALSLVEEAHEWLKSAPRAYVDKVNISNREALAALQLGDIARARRAALRGKPAAEQINDKYQIRFFDWILKIAGVVTADSGIVRTVPELEYARAEAEEGTDAALRGLCAALERELADDPTGATTIERLVLAARILDGYGSEEILAAVVSLLDLKRLLISGKRELQLGSDDSLLARRVAAEIVSQKVQSGELKAAVSAADRARARSLLLDFTLLPGQIAHLREVIDQHYNPGVLPLVDAMRRDRTPSPFRLPPKWAGPLGQLRAEKWLEHLSRDLRDWVNALTEPFGVSPLTEDEFIATAREHRQPILILHPTDKWVALFLITPDGSIRHAWSTVATKEIFAQARQLRADLGVWVSARQRGESAWFAPSSDSAAVYRAAAAALYQSLIKPIREHLTGHTHLTIMPYRELGSLPFTLLEDETGAPLLKHFSISIAPSIASLHIVKHRALNPNNLPFAYVVGDPATPAALRLERLPGAAIEAGSVRDRLAATHPGLSILFRTGLDATPANYLKEASGAKLVHLACHAGVGMTASASALYLAPGPDGDSTLDFAEIARAPLENALVFLAACRSGAGRATADGTVGLAREVLRAGARAVVASYWKVSDEATRILVSHFYDRFLNGAKSERGGNERVDVAAALRYAMLATRDDLSRQTEAGQGASAHPGGWGPFFVLGDGGLRDAL